ncbi:hypothetical protein HNR44_003252 [Geomicrobium halophilum]|uniref:Uncharacterized protein n=1 Tax=Geomicrobium halophilum TaxID=549000 RepID=A0A841Q2R8_9BACL|nr:hypothetical protein [Geomicrobium halophilum]MBB6451258.1 hypothetical protein [Geomicrobium halophilum]
MSKKWLYSLLSGVFAVGMLAACGDMEEDPGAPPEDDGMGEEEGDM